MIGIDKIELTTREYSLRDATPELFGFSTTIKQGDATPTKIWLIDGAGREISATKVFRNTDKVNITMAPHGLKISYNPSKLFHTYHLTPTGAKFNEATQIIENELKHAGISCNLHDIQLTRLDIAGQMEMDHEPYMYENVWKMYKGVRSTKQINMPGGYTFGNKGWEICAYDKKRELDANSKLPFQFDEKNLLRVEDRFLKTQYINTHLQSNNNLRCIGNLTPGELKIIYSKMINDKVFNSKMYADQLVIDYNKQGEIFNDLLIKHKTIEKTILVHFSVNQDFENFISQFGGVTGYSKFLSNIETINQKKDKAKRQCIHRAQKFIRQFIEDRQQYANHQHLSIGELISEVKEKFAA